MWQKLEGGVCFLLSLAWALSCTGGTYGLSCNFCQPENNYSSCLQHGSPVECSEALVNVTHLLLSQYVPALRSVSPMPEFQCFQANYTVDGETNYQMGCTFAGSHICQGWSVLSQCRIVVPDAAGKLVNVITTTNPPGYGTPAQPGAATNSSTTPRGKSQTPNYSSAISTTPNVAAILANGSTTQVITTHQETPTTVGSTTTGSRAHAVALRFDLLFTLILLNLWCQNL